MKILPCTGRWAPANARVVREASARVVREASARVVRGANARVVRESARFHLGSTAAFTAWLHGRTRGLGNEQMWDRRGKCYSAYMVPQGQVLNGADAGVVQQVQVLNGADNEKP